ncbi:YybH family protein [Muriicola sp.]|uniref:YybH family protein n=1 Tax=Muriicola sp. TaxID=2020856 RepID=UPI003C73F57E
MKISNYIIAVSLLLTISCLKKPSEANLQRWKKEILETEQQFAAMAQEKGIPTAFLYYAAEDAVLMRNNSLIIGKTAIVQQFEDQKSTGNSPSLSWKPDFVDVSSSGDLGYTYGTFVYTSQDSTGQTNNIEGVFHTVWKRQADGSWRFVWD